MPQSEPNDLLRAAREATPSRRDPGCGMSREELAAAVGLWLSERDPMGREYAFDAGHLGKLERGTVRRPSRHYAEALCAILGATPSELGFTPNGSRLRLNGTAPTVPDPTGELDPYDAERLSLAAIRPRRIDATGAGSLATILSATRRLEDSVGSAAVLPPVRRHLNLIEQFVTDARMAIRPRVCQIGANFAQFQGWLLSSTRQFEAARTWFDRATEWALEANDTDMVAGVLSFKASIAYELGQVGPMIGLSQATQRDRRVSVGLRAFSAYQEARGHAMIGDVDTASRKADEGAELAAQAIALPDGCPEWTYWYDAAFFQMQRGLTYRFIGEADPRSNDRAITELTTGLDALPPETRLSEWAAWFACDLAHVHAQAGDPDRACAVAASTTDIAARTRSEWLTTRIRLVHAQLRHSWPDLHEVRELDEHIHTVTAGSGFPRRRR